jgi:hypothetical protein
LYCYAVLAIYLILYSQPNYLLFAFYASVVFF